jgi:hypothetical protein
VLNVFSADMSNHRDINETRRGVLGWNFPARTVVQVMALARRELLLEIHGRDYCVMPQKLKPAQTTPYLNARGICLGWF